MPPGNRRDFRREAIRGCGDQGGGAGVCANRIEQGVQAHTLIGLLAFLGVFGSDFDHFHTLQVSNGVGSRVGDRAGKAQRERVAAGIRGGGLFDRGRFGGRGSTLAARQQQAKHQYSE